MNYVAGFLFESDLQRVLLRLKSRPAWQRGKLNGIGGKIEPGETPWLAMQREGREEASVDVSHLAPPGWQLFRTERFRGESPDGSDGATVHFFVAALRGGLTLESFVGVRGSGDKEPEPNVPIYYSTVPIMAREGRMLYNLEYLIPMAKVWLESGAHRRPLP